MKRIPSECNKCSGELVTHTSEHHYGFLTEWYVYTICLECGNKKKIRQGKTANKSIKWKE